LAFDRRESERCVALVRRQADESGALCRHCGDDYDYDGSVDHERVRGSLRMRKMNGQQIL
jgi:hypothetical protein